MDQRRDGQVDDLLHHQVDQHPPSSPSLLYLTRSQLKAAVNLEGLMTDDMGLPNQEEHAGQAGHTLRVGHAGQEEHTNEVEYDSQEEPTSQEEPSGQEEPTIQEKLNGQEEPTSQEEPTGQAGLASQEEPAGHRDDMCQVTHQSIP